MNQPLPQTADSTAVDAPRSLVELVAAAVQARASDLHIHRRGAVAEVAFRVDGVLVPVRTLPEGLAERVLGRIKYLARLQTWQDAVPQDGRIDRAELGVAQDVRVATYPTVTGEKVVLRLFNSSQVLRLKDLGLTAEARALLEAFLRRPAGLLLLTGPAGSGKTTTIYACLQELVEAGGKQIITVEDPVEQVLPRIMQTEVHEARGLGFAEAARHLLRQDPQVLVIGEIRDEATANIAIRSALTGHLVISTLHAGSCAGVLERLLVLCRDHSALAAGVDLVLNQRLVRQLCPECRGEGCPACLSTGYLGRRPLVEWVRLDPPARDALRAGRVQVEPARTLAESAEESVLAGTTDRAEVRRILGS